MMQLVDVEESRYSLSCKFRFLDDNFTWIFAGVYGTTSKGERELLWEDLGAIRSLWGEPWCMGGDFNTTRFLVERNREGRISGFMRRLPRSLTS